MWQRCFSRVAQDGSRIPVHAFKSSKFYKFQDEQEKTNIQCLPILKWEDVIDIDNGDKYEWYQVYFGKGSVKYDRLMYCPKTNILRSQTAGEFYQNSTVD